MCESSTLYFLRTTTGIQSEPAVFVNLGLIMTSLIYFAGTCILRSLTLVLEGKAGKKIPSYQDSNF